MHRALWTLVRLQARAVIRRMFRGARSLRGAIFLGIGLVLFLLWLGPSIVNAYMLLRPDLQVVRMYFPIAMLAFCLMNLVTSAGERAVAFSPAEVEFLFAGPFTRLELLGYKIARSAFAALFTA